MELIEQFSAVEVFASVSMAMEIRMVWKFQYGKSTYFLVTIILNFLPVSYTVPPNVILLRCMKQRKINQHEKR